MTEIKLIIYGAGSFAEYVKYVFEKDSAYKVIGLCIEKNYLEKHPHLNKESFIPFEVLKDKYTSADHEIFIAVGDNFVRKRVFDEVKNKGFRFANYISSKASTWDNLVCGQNVFIDEGTMLQPFVEIGNSTILFACNIGHHTIIGSNCLISVTTTGGNVQIGDNSFIGMNSVIKQNTRVGENNIIGMGSIIAKDTEPGSVYSSKGTIKRTTTYEEVAKKFLK